MAIFKGFFRRDDGAQIPLFEEPMNEEQTRSMLSHAQAFRLAAWLKDNIDVIHGMTYKKMADAASDGVGFRVTEGNLYGAEKTLELKLPVSSRVRPPSIKPPTRDEQIASLEERVRRLEDLLLDRTAAQPTGLAPEDRLFA